MKGFPGGTFKKFITAAEAESFANGSEPPTAPVPSTAEPATTAGTISHVQSKKRALSPDAEDGEEDWDVVYCDGSCKGNGQDGSVAGIGVWWGHNDRKYVHLKIYSLLGLESRGISPNDAQEIKRTTVQSLSYVSFGGCHHRRLKCA